MKCLIYLTLGTLLLIHVTAKPGARIVGGLEARAGQFPYSAAITVQTEDGRHFCGGALTNSQYVVTSASCISGGVLFTIQLGSSALTLEDENRVTVASSEYFTHPEFDPMTLHADVGVIKLRMMVELSDYIDNVVWMTGDVSEGTTVIILGWGQTNDSTSGLSEHLKYAEGVALSNEECQLYYGSQIDEGMVCVVGNYNEGTCLGDTGSPLIQTFLNKFYFVGISSFISGNGCETTDPSGYTRMKSYFPWLKDVVNQ